MVNRAEELITQLEAEIVKRDARVAELEHKLDQKVEFMRQLAKDGAKLDDQIAALKAQQPSAGVVPGWLITHGRDGSIVVQKPGRGGYVASMDTDNIASSILHALASDMLAESLNPCRAQAVADGYVLVPVEPTIEMIAALGFDGDADLAIGHAAISAQCVETYRKLLAAAQAAGAQSVIGGVDLDDVRGALASAHSAIVYQGQSVSYEYALRRVSKALHDLAAAPSAQQKESE